jgi:hypothetical protein
MMEDYFESVRRRIETVRHQIASLKTNRLYSQTVGSPMVDITDEWVERLKGYIETDERILREFGKEDQP